MNAPRVPEMARRGLRARRSPIRTSSIAAAVFAVATLAACDSKPKPSGDAPAVATRQTPPSTYTSLTGHFTYAVPGTWSTSVRIVEEPGVSAAGTWPGVAHAVHFLFQPTTAGAKSQSVLSVLVYDSATVAKKPGAGVEAARGAARVFMALLPAKNPYAAGADHDAFAALSPTLDAVKGAISPK